MDTTLRGAGAEPFLSDAVLSRSSEQQLPGNPGKGSLVPGSQTHGLLPAPVPASMRLLFPSRLQTADASGNALLWGKGSL